MNTSTPATDFYQDYCKKYNLHPDYAFYHHIFEDEPLPDVFLPLEELVYRASQLNKTKSIPAAIENLQVDYKEQDIHDLSYHQSIKLYTILGYLVNSYLVCNSETTVLPHPLSTLLFTITKRLEVPPVMTYPCCGFWNSEAIDPSKEVSLDNLKQRVTFTDNIGEEWFILLSVANDIEGFRALKQLVLAEQNVKEGSEEGVQQHLSKAAEIVGNQRVVCSFS